MCFNDSGAGKSTLGSALLRLMEFTQGRIEIGGVDISKVGLHQLRSAITFVPREPLLFSGIQLILIYPILWFHKKLEILGFQMRNTYYDGLIIRFSSLPPPRCERNLCIGRNLKIQFLSLEFLFANTSKVFAFVSKICEILLFYNPGSKLGPFQLPLIFPRSVIKTVAQP